MEMNGAKINSFLFRISSISSQLILLVPIFIWPLFYGYITSKLFGILFLSHLIFFSWVLFLTRNNTPILHKNIFNILLFAFVFIFLVASFLGINPQRSFWGNFIRATGWVLLFYLFLFFISTSSFFDRKHWEKLIFISVFVGMLTSLSTILAYFGLIEGVSIYGGVWLGNSSFLGTYLIFTLFLSLYLFFEDRSFSSRIFFLTKKEIKFLSFLGVIFSAFALFYSTARAATISALLGLIIFCLFYLAFKEKERRIRQIGRVLLIIFISVFLFSIVLLHIPGSIAQRGLNEYSTRSRTTVWDASRELTKERPVFGWGPANFEDAFVKRLDARLFLPEYGGEARFDKAHNVIYETLVGAGFIGLTVYLSIFIYAFYFLWAGFFRQKLSFWLAASFSALLIAYFLQNLTVFDTPVSYFMFFFVLAFLASLERQQKNIKESGEFIIRERVGWRRKIVATFIFVIFITSFYLLIFKPIATTFYVTEMAYDLPIDRKTYYYTKAEKSSSFSEIQIREYYANEIKNKFELNLASRNDLKYAANVLEKTRKNSPYSFYSRLKLAQIYNLLGKDDSVMLVRAEEVLNETLALSATNPYSYWHLAETKILQEKYQEALDLARKVIDIEPRISASHFLYLRIAKLMGDKDLIEQKTKDIKALFPDEANVNFNIKDALPLQNGAVH